MQLTLPLLHLDRSRLMYFY